MFHPISFQLLSTFATHFRKHIQPLGSSSPCRCAIHNFTTVPPSLVSRKSIAIRKLLLSSRCGLDPLQLTRRYYDSVVQGTLPAIFKGFFDFYLDGVCVQAIIVFKQLLEIGRANEGRLSCGQVEWAEAQTKHMIRSHRHGIRIWIRDVCDERVYDPLEDLEEQTAWRKWQAPLLLIMKPSRTHPYEAARVWDRQDQESSSRWLEGFADQYVLRLEARLRGAAGVAAVELAKQPRSTPDHPVGEHSPKMHGPSTADRPIRRAPSGADEARKQALLKRIRDGTGLTLRNDEVATIFEVTTKTIRNWIDEGKLSKGARRGSVTIESIKALLSPREG